MYLNIDTYCNFALFTRNKINLLDFIFLVPMHYAVIVSHEYKYFTSESIAKNNLLN